MTFNPHHDFIYLPADVVMFDTRYQLIWSSVQVHAWDVKKLSSSFRHFPFRNASFIRIKLA